MSWIGVDLDGTLAHYEAKPYNPDHVGEPIPAMVERVKAWLRQGFEVKIFTARASKKDWASGEAYDHEAAKRVVQEWAKKHIGVALEVTCEKDYGMIELFDDRCVSVEENTGRLRNRSQRGLD
jgi:hypothetical protein